ncbi:MAG: tetratricopeptide repeat protein [Acidobacteriota bacterium]
MNVPKLLKQAEKMVSYGKTNEAIQIYQEILSEDFHNLPVHNLVADLYISKQDYQRASRHLFKVAADATVAADHAAAVSTYRKIIKVLPKNILAREKLVEIFSRTGAKNEALALLSELVLIHQENGDAFKAIECLERAADLDPSNKNHRVRLAVFLTERGNKDKAVEIFYKLAAEFTEEQSYDDAIASLEKIRTINPAEKNISARLAGVYEHQGKIQQAIEVTLAALKQDPARTDLMSSLGRLCLKAGRIDEAQQVYEKLARLSSSFLKESFPLVEVLLANKKLDQALRQIETVCAGDKEAETRKKCVEFLEEILKLDPQKLDAYRLLEACYSSSFQFDQLAITLLSHADAYVAKCNYAQALDLAKQLIDLDPYNEEYRRKFTFIEKLAAGGGPNRSSILPSKKTSAPAGEDDEEELYAKSTVDSHFDPKVSLITDEDVENFIVDIELLEKFGQRLPAIRRLESVLKTYPQEIRLRQKLKTLFFDQKMPKKAAQECLEIAKILQQSDQKEEANRYLREAQRLNPILSNARRDPVSRPVLQTGSSTAEKDKPSALKGDLSEIGLLDVIQILDNAQKSGRLVINSEGREGTIFFNSGRIVNAHFLGKQAEPAMYELVAVKGGDFEYLPVNEPFAVVINNSNTNLLLEGLRLLDEANRDLSDSETSAEEQPVDPLPTHGKGPSPTPVPPNQNLKPLTEPEETVCPPPRAKLPPVALLDEVNPLGEV